MKKFVFPKYLKFMPSISEWSSNIYTFNKRNLFLLNNNEKKHIIYFVIILVLIYHIISQLLILN